MIGELARELPAIRTFATLSPIPGFRAWAERRAGSPETFASLADRAIGGGQSARRELTALCAAYLIDAKRADGRALDAVANFHLSNGARLERLNWLADASARGLRSSAGLMVTYVYDPAGIAANAARYEDGGIVAAAPELRRLARSAVSGSTA